MCELGFETRCNGSRLCPSTAGLSYTKYRPRSASFRGKVRGSAAGREAPLVITAHKRPTKTGPRPRSTLPAHAALAVGREILKMEDGGGSEPYTREAGQHRTLQLSRHSVDSARSANTSAATTVATANTGSRWSSAATTSSLLHQVAARVGALDVTVVGEAHAGPQAAAGSGSGSAGARPPSAAPEDAPLPVHVVVCQPDGTLELAVDPDRLAKPPGPESERRRRQAASGGADIGVQGQAQGAGATPGCFPGLTHHTLTCSRP